MEGVSAPSSAETGVLREDVFWTATAPRMPDYPVLRALLRVDVAIVGSGFTGLACAYYLRRHAPHLRVAVVEAARVGSGASSRNSGLFGPYYAGWRREMRRGGSRAELYRGLGERAYARLLAFLNEEDVACDVLPAKTLLLAADPEAPDLRSQGEAWSALGLSVAWFDRAGLAQMIGTTFYAGACGLGNRWRLHPAKLVAGLAAAAARAGAVIFEGSPVLAVDTATPARLRTPAGVLVADRVVLATNGYTPRLGFAAEAIVPVHHAVLVTRPLAPSEATVGGLAEWPARLEVAARTHTMRLTADGRVTMRETLGYAANSSTVWPDLEAAYARAREAYITRYPWVRAIAIEGRWHCLTAHTENGHVIFGPIAGSHIFASAGYNGSGVVAGHYHGYLLARHLAGETPDDYRLLCDLEPPAAIRGEARRRHYVDHGVGV